MKILMVRHGETDYNKNHLVQGHTDIPLNETGIGQAILAAEKIYDYEISAAFSSPMERAYDTARYMLDNSDNREITITRDERIIEKHYGKFEGATYEEWHRGQANNDISTVELDTNVANRVKEFLLEKYKDYREDTILVVCHGACTRIFLEHNKLRPNQDYIVNTSLTELDYDGQEFRLVKYNV